MSRYYSHGFAPYVPVAMRRHIAAKEMEKLRKQGVVIEPINITGRKITTSFWGNAWCDNLENYSDFSNRMPRGRTYARNGSVVHLAIKEGVIEAFIAGSSLYQATISITPLSDTIWQKIKNQASGKITNLLDLLQGKLPTEILTQVCNPDDGIFPKPKEIKFSCSCPDGADMCKHIAAVLYGVGHRLDSKPELFFTLRSVNMQDLITSAGEHTALELAAPETTLNNDDLADIFGIELDTPTTISKKSPKKQIAKKTAAKKLTSKKTTAKKVAAKKLTSKKTTAKKVAAKKLTSKKTTAKKTTAKKLTSKKVAVKKATAKKTAAKKRN